MLRKAGILLLVMLLTVDASGAEPLRIGTTFSRRQSEYLELDWQQTYQELLEFQFDVLRLGSYWNLIEKDEGVFDFETLDWQLDRAAERGISVVLTVGMKAPRWPEYYIPDWAMKNAGLKFGQDLSRNAYLCDKTLLLVRTVVERYRNHPAVRYWQVENEGLDRAGRNYWWIGRDLIRREIELVRSLDPQKRPIIVSAATYPNDFLNFLARFFAKNDPISDALDLGDILGINVYPIVGHQMWHRKFYFWTTPEERRNYFSSLLSRAKARGRPVWIMELQAEPWEPGELVHVGKERPPSGWPESVQESFEEFQELGFQTILLWGSEYWIYRRLHHQDQHWWEMVFDFFKSKDSKKTPKILNAQTEAASQAISQ